MDQNKKAKYEMASWLLPKQAYGLCMIAEIFQGGGKASFWASENYTGRVTRPNGGCSQMLISNTGESLIFDLL